MGRDRDHLRRAAPAIVLTAFGCAVPLPAKAQEYCVACTEPQAVYRCVIDGAQPGGGQPLQMLCITTLAKQGGHASCGVKRGTVFDCDGAVKRIPWAALNAPQQPEPALPWAAGQPKPEPATAAAAPAPASGPPPAQPAPDAPPDTVLELAKRANEDTAKQFKKAGESVKDASKKTWDCVASLFTRCW
jgi:hypothetical protein